MSLRILSKASYKYRGNFTALEKEKISNYLSSILNNINKNKITILKDNTLLVKVLNSHNKEITNFYVAEIM